MRGAGGQACLSAPPHPPPPPAPNALKDPPDALKDPPDALKRLRCLAGAPAPCISQSVLTYILTYRVWASNGREGTRASGMASSSLFGHPIPQMRDVSDESRGTAGEVASGGWRVGMYERSEIQWRTIKSNRRSMKGRGVQRRICGAPGSATVRGCFAGPRGVLLVLSRASWHRGSRDTTVGARPVTPPLRSPISGACSTSRRRPPGHHTRPKMARRVEW